MAEKHCMADLKEPELLSEIPIEWCATFQEIRKYTSIVGKFLKYSNSSKIYFIGAGHKWILSNEEIPIGDKGDINNPMVQFKCTGSIESSTDCTSRLVLYQKKDKIADKLSYTNRGEILTPHTCSASEHRRFVLHYIDVLIKYIREKNYAKDALKSYIGFWLKSNKNTASQDRLLVFDHCLYSKTNTVERNAYNVNFLCEQCGITVYINQVDGKHCHLISKHAENSIELTKGRFAFKVNDDILPFHSGCKSPVYIHRKFHVLGRGLADIMPHIRVICQIFGWETAQMNEYKDGIEEKGETFVSDAMNMDYDDFDSLMQCTEAAYAPVDMKVHIKSDEYQQAFFIIILGCRLNADFIKIVEANDLNAVQVAMFGAINAGINSIVTDIEEVLVTSYPEMKNEFQQALLCTSTKLHLNTTNRSCNTCNQIATAHVALSSIIMGNSNVLYVCNKCENKLKTYIAFKNVKNTIEQQASTQILQIHKDQIHNNLPETMIHILRYTPYKSNCKKVMEEAIKYYDSYTAGLVDD